MYAQIIIEIVNSQVDKVFNYKIPPHLQNLELGMRVKIPFGKGNKIIEGYVIGFCSNVDISDNKLKYIDSICNSYPIFTPETVELAKWMKTKYYCTLTECLKCIMPSGVNLKPTKIKYASLNKDMPLSIYEKYKSSKIFNRRLEIIDLLKSNGTMSLTKIKELLKTSDSPIKALEKDNMIVITEEEIIKSHFELPNISQTENLMPTDEQKQAIDCIVKSLNNDKMESFLIHGVTGSGKTEIYLQLIEHVIKMDKQAIVLVPEISLTPQTLARFVSRFGKKVSITHSKMSASERFEEWNRARVGDSSIMIGPRSAIFTPFKNLGIIIIDEEHENTYKSEFTPKYSASEVAIKRCLITNSKLVLGSATPSIETYYNAVAGNIKLFTLKERTKNSKLPQIKIVDMRNELAKGNKSIFSLDLKEQILNNLQKREQTILFLNRRGHSTFVSCRKCGYVAKCNDCNIPYTYHQDTQKLTCHYCGKTEKSPSICPSCGSKYIKYFGLGTQKVEEETKKQFPSATVMRMDMDTVSRKNSHEKILKSFATGEIDILIGTQMIAKGHDFPNVTLVGVIAADLSLNLNDFRGNEITFQLLTQVSGRAGRAELEGKVFIQTYNPENYAIALAKTQDYEKFYNEEIVLRQMMDYPPFSNIFIFLITGENEKNVINAANKLMDILKFYNRNRNFRLMGIAPANLSKLNKQYRWRIIIKYEDEEKLKSYALYCYNKFKQINPYADIKVHLNMNPLVSI